MDAITEGSRRRVWSLTSGGEIFGHLAEDVTFAIPDYFDRSAVASCGKFDPNMAEFETMTPKEISARVQVLKAIRSLEKDVEGEYPYIALRVSQVLASASASWFNEKEWCEVSTKEVAALVRAQKVVEKLCVHKYLMSHHDRFVAYTTDFLSNQKFWVRPQAHLDDLTLVSTLIARRDPQLDSFAEKARRLVTSFRERQEASSEPAVSADPNNSFSPEEQAIIRVLHGFVRNTRSTQKDPYVIPVATIVKKIGLYNVKIDTSLVHRLLIEMGSVPPWDDPVSKERELHLIPPRNDILALPSNPLPSLSTLGPDEFYPYDTVEHVRHDFKGLPAFVIDDVGAQELDDGVSIERIPSEPDRYWVHVHIADPTLKVHPSHTLAQQARLKQCTAYDVHQTSSMFPSSLMYDGLSLGSRAQQNLPENVLTFSAKVDEFGDIVDYQVRAGLLHNIHILRYDEVDKLLGLPAVPKKTPFSDSPAEDDRPTPSLSPEHKEDLRLLHTVALKLVLNRFNKEGLWWSVPNASITMTPKPPPLNPTGVSQPAMFMGFPKLTYEVECQHSSECGARRLVAESMKIACRVASRFFRDRNIPAMRRASAMPTVHAEGGWEMLLSKRQPDGYVDLDTIVSSSVAVPRGEYTVEPKGHYALGVPDGEGYTRVTSPLRRYGDLVAHWQVKHALAATSGSSKHLFDGAWLDAFVRETTAKEMALRQIERRHDLFWSLKYLDRWQAAAQSHPERPNPLDHIEAIVTREADHDIVRHRPTARVTAFNLGVTAKMEIKDDRPCQLGDRVLVKFKEIKLGTSPEFIVSRL